MQRCPVEMGAAPVELIRVLMQAGSDSTNLAVVLKLGAGQMVYAWHHIPPALLPHAVM